MMIWNLLARTLRRLGAFAVLLSTFHLFAQDPAGAYITSPSGNLTVNVGTTINFAGTTDYGTRLNWNFGDGTTTTGFSVYKTYTTGGTFTVTLTATGMGYDSSTATRTITVIPVGISISPTSASLATSATKQFAATVTGTTNTGVTWSCTGGSINTAGLYTAPATPGTYTVTATSVADTSKKANATVTVAYPPVTISLSPTSVQLNYGQTRTFSATVTGGNGSTAVTWSCTAGTITSGGLYTAPATTGTYTVTAQAQADASKTASATVQVAAPVAVSLSPKTLTLTTGQSQTFSATVTGGFSGTSVSWSCTGGTVNGAGTFTAPGTPGTYTVTATSVSDPSKSDSATVTVQAPVTISVAPTSVALAWSQTRTFTATVTGGNGSTGVNWSCSAGTITAGGLYTAPATTGTYTVTAQAQADTSKTASATVTVTPPVAVTISPASATLVYGQAQTFTASVSGGSGNTAVTWSCTGGTVTSGGAFTAPSASGTCTVTATSVADPSKSASAPVTVVAPTSVSVTPSSTTLIYGATQQFGAPTSGGAGGTTIAWSCTAGTITPSGLFTAPSSSGTVTVTATATTPGESPKTAMATVTVVPPASVTMSPTAVTLLTGGSQTFSASVSGGTGSTAVTWSCSGGSITSAGVFTAPGAAGTVTVTATSVSDPSRKATATVTVVNLVSVSVSPGSAALTYGQGQTFTATVTGGPGGYGVTWSCTGGSITAGGVYTAPNTAGTYIVTATHTWDPSKTGSATVTVSAPKVVTGISVSPATVTLDGGQSQVFTATVTGTGGIDGSVTWSASAGAITPAGLFTAPNAAGTVTITATSVQDPSKKATATVTVRVLVWEADILYVGTREVAEVDASGLHVTHVDHLGSPRLVTGPNGQVESRQKYMPYGEMVDPPETYTPRKGYTNHEATDPSGLIYMQARFYLPMYGRFISPDPARDQHFEDTQSWNIYSYVRNSPVLLTDPTGLAVHALPDFDVNYFGGPGRASVFNPSVPGVTEIMHGTSSEQKKEADASAKAKWDTDEALVKTIQLLAIASPEIGKLMKSAGVTADQFMIDKDIPGEGRTVYLPVENGTGLQVSSFRLNPDKIGSLTQLAEKVGHELTHAVQAKETQNGGKTDCIGGKIDFKGFQQQIIREATLIQRIKLGSKEAHKEYERLGIETKAREGGSRARREVEAWLLRRDQ